ncbi:MAG: hypothetical protein ACLQL8_04295 [Thermoplasmata archaeon]
MDDPSGDVLDRLLLDPEGRSSTRRSRVYPVHELHRLLRRGAGRRLERERVEEQARFRTLAPRFPTVLRELLRRFPASSTDPEWTRFNAGIVQQMVPDPPFAFLRRPPLTPSVYMDAYDPVIAAELSEVERRLKAMSLSPRELLRENAVGGPWVYDRQYLTSSALVRHLLHVLFLSNESGVGPSELHRVVEWGAGYGSLARVLFRLQPNLNYVILDTPVMLAVQWLFLSTVLGPDRVVLPGSGDAPPLNGCVHLEDASTFDPVGAPSDLFVSTFALSESPRDLIERVEALRWFGAQHLWLAYTPTNPHFPQWRTLEEAALRSGARTIPHPYRPLDRYACR